MLGSPDTGAREPCPKCGRPDGIVAGEPYCSCHRHVPVAALAAGVGVPPDDGYGLEVRRQQTSYLYDQWGIRIAHCENRKPHKWHGWVGGNEDLRCPGLPAGVGEARPAEPPLNERVAEAREALEGGRESTVDYLIGAPAEEQPDARAWTPEAALAYIIARPGDADSDAAIRDLAAECVGLREQLDAAHSETGEYRRMWEETLTKLDAAKGRLADLDSASIEARDAVYRERNQLVAALSKLFPASLERHTHEDAEWEDDWRWVVFIDLPTGQVSWHIHDSELMPLFSHLPMHAGREWDGHDTPTKYARLAALGVVAAGETLVANSAKNAEIRGEGSEA